MKILITSIALYCYFLRASAQDSCTIIPPDSLYIHEPIYYGTPTPVIVYGVLQDSSWFSFYEDYCCDHLLYQSYQDTFSIVLHQSGIIWVRSENFCDTSDAVGVDIDVIMNNDPLTVTQPYLSIDDQGIIYLLDGTIIGSFINKKEQEMLIRTIPSGIYLCQNTKKKSYTKLVKLE